MTLVLLSPIKDFMFITGSLFPTPLVTSNINRPITEEERSRIDYYKQHTYNNIGNITSKNTYLLKDEFPEINNFIKSGIDHYVNTIICPAFDLEFYITQSWLNYTEPSQAHHKHAHPNSIISGVFYFNAEEGKDKIHFYNDFYRQLVIPPKQWNHYNSLSWWVPVKTGDLVMFPSSVVHMVEQTQSSDTRVSLAFNVFAKGYLGDDESLTGLHL
jgi:uncharacterized protein (TIGR02466 family)